MAGKVSLSTIGLAVMRYIPVVKWGMGQSAVDRSLGRLPDDQLPKAEKVLRQRMMPGPDEILDIICKNSIPKELSMVLFDPHPAMVPTAVRLFKQVYVVESDELMRDVTRRSLNYLRLGHIPVTGQYPERGQYNAVYAGDPSNKGRIKFPYLPSGALLIFTMPHSTENPAPVEKVTEGMPKEEANLSFEEKKIMAEERLKKEEERRQAEARLKGDEASASKTFSFLANSGYSRVHLFDDKGLENESLYIFKKP